jgi:hypothetical protein
VVLDNLHKDMKAAGNPIKRFIERPLFEFRDEEKYTEHLPHPLDIEHLIIVDRDPLVDLLVLNDFPKHSKSLIVSQSGYPNYVIPIAKELLMKRKSLTVYLLHDSTQSRIAMKRSLADFALIPTGGHRMFNLDLEPEQVVYMRCDLSIPSNPPARNTVFRSIRFPMRFSRLHSYTPLPAAFHC